MLRVIHRSGSTQLQGVFSGAFVTGTFALNLVHACARVPPWDNPPARPCARRSRRDTAPGALRPQLPGHASGTRHLVSLQVALQLFCGKASPVVQAVEQDSVRAQARMLAPMSGGASRSGAFLKERAPVPASMLNFAWSVPPTIE